jgi:hypothetical protein
MNPKTSALLQQAGEYIRLGKLTLALEQYISILELEPNDTTVINMIGDLHGHVGNRAEAFHSYLKLGRPLKTANSLLPPLPPTKRS